MQMHIALADSNPGDRKQMERLLSRESDKRVNTTGVFYIETFGSSGALLSTPIMYNVYFLDVTDEGNNAYDIALRLREKGVKAPIVFCVSSLDYREFEKIENTLFIDKPIRADELTKLMDDLIEDRKRKLIPTVEFRDNYESFYLEEDKIAYIEGIKYNVRVFLADGTQREANGFIDNIWKNIKTIGCFVPINNKTIVNSHYIARVSGLVCQMKDGTKLMINPLYKSRYKIEAAK